MLQRKVTESGYIRSLERYHDLLLNDQQLLTARLKEKDSEIAYAEDKTGLLEVELQELRCKMEIKGTREFRREEYTGQQKRGHSLPEDKSVESRRLIDGNDRALRRSSKSETSRRYETRFELPIG